MESVKLDGDDNCSICLDALLINAAKEGLVQAPCQHVFHKKCLIHWLISGNPGGCCPLCKVGTTIEDVTPVSVDDGRRRSRRIMERQRLLSASTQLTQRDNSTFSSGESTSSQLGSIATQRQALERQLDILVGSRSTSRNSFEERWEGFCRLLGQAIGEGIRDGLLEGLREGIREGLREGFSSVAPEHSILIREVADATRTPTTSPPHTTRKYPLNFLKKRLHIVRTKEARRSSMTEEEIEMERVENKKKSRVIHPYCGPNTYRVANFVRFNMAVEIGYRPGIKLGRFLCNLKSRNCPDKKTPGVYIFGCINNDSKLPCGSSYIGESGIDIYDRFTQHEDAIRLHNPNSAVAKHIDEHPNHVINKNSLLLLEHEPSDGYRKVMESLYIRASNNLMYVSTGTRIHPQWCATLTPFFKFKLDMKMKQSPRRRNR